MYKQLRRNAYFGLGSRISDKIMYIRIRNNRFGFNIPETVIVRADKLNIMPA
jgi:hypothetical protein